MATTLDEATIARQANRRIRRSDNITGWAFANPMKWPGDTRFESVSDR